MEIISSIIYCVVGLIGLAWLVTSFVVVRQKQVAIIEVLGKFSGTRQAGFSLKAPWPLGRVAYRISTRVLELKENIGVKSKDNAFLLIPVKVQYHAIDPQKAAYELQDAAKQIMSYIVNVVRAKANSMDMDLIFQSKDTFSKEVKGTLEQVMNKYGYEIDDVLVDDPQPSDELKKAFDRVLAAQRDKDASLLEKDAIKNRVVGKSEAEAESLKLKAAAYVDVRTTMAKGNSAALKEFCEGLEGVDHAMALSYFAGLDARDAIRDAAGNPGSVILFPVGGMTPDLNTFVGTLAANRAAAAHEKPSGSTATS